MTQDIRELLELAAKVKSPVQGEVMGKKLCELCKQAPATVPDRNKPGRLVNRVCFTCHSKRLTNDMRRVIDFAAVLQRESSSLAAEEATLVAKGLKT